MRDDESRLLDADIARQLERAARGIPVAGAVGRAQPAVLAAWDRSVAGRSAGDRAQASAATAGAPHRATGWLAPLLEIRARLTRPEPSLRTGGGRGWTATLRPVLAGMVVLAATTGTVAASAAPGAPLYGPRLVVERALLPAPGAGGRVDAELAYAKRRLDEAGAAIAHHDDRAAAAAVAAYTDAIRELAADVPSEAVVHLERSLDQSAHQLASLRAATDGADIRDALAAADREVDGIRARWHPVHHWIRPARWATLGVDRRK